MSNLFLLFVYPPRTPKNRDEYKKIKHPIVFSVIFSREIPNIRFKSRFPKEKSAVCVAPKIAHNLRIQQPFNKHTVADVSLSPHGGTDRRWRLLSAITVSTFGTTLRMISLHIVYASVKK